MYNQVKTILKSKSTSNNTDNIGNSEVAESEKKKKNKWKK